MENIETVIENKVANSGLITLDLEDIFPKGERVLYDLKQNLYLDLILKEKDFRDFLKLHDWSSYQGKNVAITCSEDVIIPTWAYMLLATKLQPLAKKIVFGNLENLENELFNDAIQLLDLSVYTNAKVVVKGCSTVAVPASAYVKITTLLVPIVQSVMFGEPCSTVPVYKKSKVL